MGIADRRSQNVELLQPIHNLRPMFNQFKDGSFGGHVKIIYKLLLNLP